MKTRHLSSESTHRQGEPVTRRRSETIQAILVAVEFSESGKSALQFANTLAQQLGCTLTVVNVVEPLATDDPVAVSATLAHGRDLQETQQALESFALRELSRDVLGASHVLIGKPVEQITKCAQSLNADLLVIGVQRDGSGVLAMGSTADALLKHAACPVLMIPS